MIRPRLARLGAVLGAVSALSCSQTARFVDAPPVAAVDDMATIAEPEEHEFLPVTYFGDILLFGRIDRVLGYQRASPPRTSTRSTRCPIPAGSRTVSDSAP